MTYRTHHLSRFANLALVALFASTAASAHVTLPPGGATAGTDYDAAFRVGHACKDAQATTGITVQLPEGFRLSEAQARKGWTLASNPREVAWKAESPATALPGAERAEFCRHGGADARAGADDDDGLAVQSAHVAPPCGATICTLRLRFTSANKLST